MSGRIISPWDRYNQELAGNVHPPDWVNPEPSGRYNLVVIGAGTAGLVTAAGAAGLGARVALIERHLMGGDCLNVGCVPSKTLLRSARAMADVRAAAEFAVIMPREGLMVDFPGVMERVRALRAGISKHDSAKRFRDLGIDVFLGQAKFLDGKTVEVSGKKLRFKSAVIATGGRAAHPKVNGLTETGFLTNETVFSLTEQPARLAVIGGGPIGCELAQGFARLGSRVTLLHKNEHLLDREDAEAAELIQKQFSREQIEVVTGAHLLQASKSAGGKTISFRSSSGRVEVTVDEILVAAGRAPNIEELALEAAGVACDPRAGILVNDYLQTSNRRIYAAGDVCLKWKFTHAADAAARIVIQNALFIKARRVSALTMPWCTYTDPEVAHVGLYEHEAAEQGVQVDTYKELMSNVDRAITDGEENGFVKIHVRRNTNHILGATIVARHAGEMISEISAAMAGRLRLTDLANVIHPYPTQAEAIRKCADACNRARLTPAIKTILSAWLRWRRQA
jgi:pyruvate/2-oxoglutarate dehydrogenase complex dihydrolipoamide dehydrogenase (E3) component